ncbi:DoxX family membrane protein [Tellurirhabdus bombi]|uniref:DoxX family membrane protein n=1 Tax=Tellurirhabdus bombi TaxID=2907205 RepID=UPI001F330D21|nr:DoxX family membrane protein [Tellurirhabdus bombi]
MNNQQLAFITARLTVAICFIGHGIVRLPKLQGFSDWMVDLFSKTFLPAPWVRGFSYFVPTAELLLGALLFLGLFTRASIMASMLLLLALLFGSNLVEEWNWITSQMIYSLFFMFLFQHLEHNSWALDNLIKRPSLA